MYLKKKIAIYSGWLVGIARFAPNLRARFAPNLRARFAPNLRARFALARSAQKGSTS